MTPLRQRMLDDMRVRNLSPLTQTSYLEHVARFARHFHTSPEALGPANIRAYQVYLTTKKQLAPSTIVVTIAALRFLYSVTLKRDWAVETVLPLSKRPKTLPVILSADEVQQFLAAVVHPKPRAVLTTCYAAGLRISEAVRLQVTDIDSNRRVLRVAHGKGQRDRYVMLSPKLLDELRTWWRVERPTRWLFPGARANTHIGTNAVTQACRHARWRSGIAQAHHSTLPPARLRRASARRRHQRPDYPAAPRPPESDDHRPVSACGGDPGVLGDEPVRSAPAAGRPSGRSRRPVCSLSVGAPMDRSPLQVAEVFRCYGASFRAHMVGTLSTAQRRVMSAIERCRTAALGGHVEQCDRCGHMRVWYNSGRNRHCPQCQALARATWITDRMAELLPTEYFHVVFTARPVGRTAPPAPHHPAPPATASLGPARWPVADRA